MLFWITKEIGNAIEEAQAGGAIGGAVARAFASEGAKVFLAGRSQAKLDSVAGEISAAGGAAETAIVDALDAKSVDEHADAVVRTAGSIDISFNAIGVKHVQGVPLAELDIADYLLPITTYATTHFLTATAAARHMTKAGTGVILTISTPTALLPKSVAGGFGVACAAVEGLSRQLAGELGEHGIRVICLRPDGIPEAVERGSHSGDVFAARAERAGISLEEFLASLAEGNLLHRSPTLTEVANVATLVVSDRASAMTGTVADANCGALVD